MSRASMPASREDRFELRFNRLSERTCEYAFPCDAAGRVVIDELTERERIDYFYARAVVGAELSAPIVSAVLHLVEDLSNRLKDSCSR